MKRVDQLFGKKGSSPMTYFVTCSRPEHDIVVREFDYEPEDVPITGFARWDVLEDKSTPDDPFILMMPTWRWTRCSGAIIPAWCSICIPNLPGIWIILRTRSVPGSPVFLLVSSR